VITISFLYLAINDCHLGSMFLFVMKFCQLMTKNKGAETYRNKHFWGKKKAPNSPYFKDFFFEIMMFTI